jgi:hypothetical protein
MKQTRVETGFSANYYKINNTLHFMVLEKFLVSISPPPSPTLLLFLFLLIYVNQHPQLKAKKGDILDNIIPILFENFIFLFALLDKINEYQSVKHTSCL